MRKYLLEIVIGILAVLSIGVVLALGYLSYSSISSIIDTIHNDAAPNEKLTHIKELALELEKAENSIRVYSFTHDNKDLNNFNLLVKNHKSLVAKLIEDGAENEIFLANIDTIQILVQTKIRVWNDMIPLYGERQTVQYLDTLSGTLESKIADDSARKNRNILKKIFKRSKKTEIDEGQIIQNIEQHKQQDQEISQTIRKKEQELAATNRLLTERFYNLINKMEDDEAQLLIQKEEKVNELADQTYIQIKQYAMGGVIAAILVVLIILRYSSVTRKSVRALKNARVETERLAAAKELFVANVSHEIRTPVNLISGFTSQLLQKELDNEIREDLLIVKSSSDHLARVVDDVLDFSKLQTDKMKLYAEHFSLKSLAEQIFLLFESKAKDADINLQYNIEEGLPSFLFGDSVRLKQILINLLGNAIKFSPKGNVSFSFHMAKNQPAEEGKINLEIRVKDEGIGIDKEKLDLIFEDYTQAESDTTKKYGGTGLGLSIVKKLIDLHQGSIEIESNKGQGTQFICFIPYDIGDTSLVKSATGNLNILPDAIKNLKVLIVDDETYNRKLIKNILSKWQVSSEEAADGAEAIEKLKAGQFDVVLLDLRMPKLDGMQVCRFIREELKLDASKVAVIIITAAAVSPDDEQKYQEAGANTWLPKPFQESALLDVFLQLTKNEKSISPKELLSEKNISPQSDPAVNLQELYRVANNDKKFVEDMLRRLQLSFNESLKHIEKAIIEGNLNQIGEATHKISSPSRHIGATSLLLAIKSLEEMAVSKADNQAIQKEFEVLQKEVEIVNREIDDHLKSQKS